jgi:hypothetical protein
MSNIDQMFATSAERLLKKAELNRDKAKKEMADLKKMQNQLKSKLRSQDVDPNSSKEYRKLGILEKDAATDYKEALDQIRTYQGILNRVEARIRKKGLDEAEGSGQKEKDWGNIMRKRVKNAKVR